MSSLSATLETQLTQALAPTLLQVIDESHLHAGHAGARGGGGHFDVTVVSEAFAGKSRVERHQMVYAAVAELLRTGAVHALAIRARTAAEWATEPGR